LERSGGGVDKCWRRAAVEETSVGEECELNNALTCDNQPKPTRFEVRTSWEMLITTRDEEESFELSDVGS
jgi:hypothetical protein